MLAVISPAKSLDFDSPLPDLAVTQARFPEATERLATGLRNMTRKKLQQVMPVSDKLIDLNRSRYADFFAQDARPAIYAYNGDVYTGFEAATLDDAGIAFAQDHLRILSGLYGLLRPLDEIRPHRLEMGTKWAPRRKKLTDFWDDRIATALADDLDALDDHVLVNLASNEYWAAVEPHADKLGARIVACDFRQDGPDGPRFISFEGKRARGLMARFICENHLRDVEALKDFDTDGYRFDAEASDDETFRFLRT